MSISQRIRRNSAINQKNQTIKYKYALDTSGEIISIDQVVPSNRSEYKCLSCGGKLVAVLGEKRQKHFRHAVVTESCSLETYLHHMGKLLFYETYQSCLKNGKKYEIEIKKPRVCNYCKDITNYCKEATICKMADQLVRYDLTEYFKHISLEKADGDFIPDVQLTNNSGEKIYIEIMVTHESTPQKIA